MPQNQFVPFGTGAGATTLPAASYANEGYVAQGFQDGVLEPEDLNTVLRQGTFVASAIAQFVADNQNADVLDDGVVSNFTSKFFAALQGALSSSSVHFGVATGTGDAMVLTAVPPMVKTTSGGYQPGSFLVVETPATANTSAAPTINVNSIGNIAITRAGSGALVAGDNPGMTWIILFFDGTACHRLGLTASDVAKLIPTPPAPPTPITYDATPQDGLFLDANNGFGMRASNLPASTILYDTDLSFLSRADGQGTFSATVGTLSTYITNKVQSSFTTNNTFVMAGTPASQAAFTLGSNQSITRNTYTTIILADHSCPFAVTSGATGVVNITESGLYLVTATAQTDSFEASGELEYVSLLLEQNGGLLAQAFTASYSFGEGLAGLNVAAGTYCAAGDKLSLVVFMHATNNDDTGDYAYANATQLKLTKVG